MKVSYKWLKDYVDVSGFSAQELAEKLTRGGIEVDGVEARNQGVTGVVVGYVKSKEKHPDADKLNVCQVDVGTGEELQIVCGARNVDAGQHVPVATVGAKLPGGLAIKRAKLRGVESQGMICSAKELGINDKLLPKEQQDGILVLPQGLKLGTPIADVLGLDDEILDLDLTPNRSDALSMLGVAYEIAALTGGSVKLPEFQIPASSAKAEDHISVQISSPEQCSHYAARYIKGIKLAPSPQWMQNRLIAAGVRPISNIVDITNYVMLEYGQPLHAFDADKVAGGKIDVRLAREGETLETLDGQLRKLEPHMLVITDGTQPIALAGVMGGANSEVSEDTVNILLESAHFDGGTVRKTSRQFGLRSEASIRFEKEVDPAVVLKALERAASLIAEYADGHIAEGVVAAGSEAIKSVQISVSRERINRYLGTELSGLEIKTIFGRLNVEYEEPQPDSYVVRAPSRRGDITRDVDIIEEIARLYGYDNIPTTPIEGATTPGALTASQAIRRQIRNRLTDAGLHEVISYSFTSPERTSLFPAISGNAVPVRLSMPMSEDRSVLRTSILPNLLDIAAYNRNRKNENIAIFEAGSVFLTDEAELTRQPHERQKLAALLTGSRRHPQWNVKAEAVDFYDIKGVLEAVIELLGLSGKVNLQAAAPEQMHPGRTAAILLDTPRGSETIGYIGQLHPDTQRELDLADTYVFELNLEALYEAADSSIVYRALPRFPASTRDIAVVIDRKQETGSLKTAIVETAGELLESVEVFDIYTGERLGADKKSVALSLVYRHAERTLTDEEVTELHAKVVERLEQSFHAELRK
ncbi:phenylalanine--tRNA ligase subunit beta [Paenibacillus sp. GCM10012307]|uniref:Phenylalanine--tRNA ligase beta subunit n=1 Tax=Paenibacillus roseus TaxID=2798579 RepID=A0A934J8Q2_9BACL|nr:phenylalanine--tRNA ligase subunit beta [Paenibacillus roseus]MBJ6363874.1 phenylalanine--tRNA ligase subunit beta [Paenibacillus roseus]